MRILNSLYPYPVLTQSEDFKDGYFFKVDFEMVPATPFKSAKLIANYHLNEPNIQRLINNDQAGMFLHVESPRAAYRKMHKVENNTYELEINLDNMRTVVEITAFILATDHLEGLKNGNINSEMYGDDYIFPTLENGNPLAVNYTILLELDEIDDLSKVSSIIKVAQTKENMMYVNYDGDTIFVYLPEKLYEKYLDFQILGEVLLSSIIVPALVHVIDAIGKNAGEGMHDRKWFKVIEKKLEIMGYSMNQVYNDEITSIQLAQEIFNNPLERMFSEVESVVSQNED